MTKKKTKPTAGVKLQPSGTARAASQTKPKPKGAPKSRAFGKALAANIASLVPGGGPFSSLAGEAGGWLGDKIGTFLGLGDYEVRQNSLISEGSTPPSMHQRGEKVIVRHREYLGDVFSSATPGAFKIASYSLNPGLETTMPWMAQVAKAYRQWRPRGLVFEFKSNTGLISSAATPAVGMVIMATDYNSFDTTPFANKMEMENNMFTTSAKTTESFYHPIECAPMTNVLESYFVRPGALPTDQPPQFYDQGVFAIASVGCPVANQNLGELWLTAEVEFDKSTMQNVVGHSAPSALFFNDANAGLVLSLPFSPVASVVPAPTNTLACTLAEGTGTNPIMDIVFANNTVVGDYLVCLCLSTLAVNSLSVQVDATSVDCAGLNQEIFGNTVSSNNYFWNGKGLAATAAQNWMAMCRIHVTGPNPRLKIGAISASAATAFSASRYVYITRIGKDTVHPAALRENPLKRLRANVSLFPEAGSFPDPEAKKCEGTAEVHPHQGSCTACSDHNPGR